MKLVKAHRNTAATTAQLPIGLTHSLTRLHNTSHLASVSSAKLRINFVVSLNLELPTGSDEGNRTNQGEH